MIKNCVRLAVLLIIVIFNSSCEAGMFTKKEDVVLFSSVRGKILYKGEPVAHAKVIRRYKYDTQNFLEDSCIASEKGEFLFPLIDRKNTSTTPLVQFVVYQQIFVVRDGVEQQIWGHGKMETSVNSEYGGEFKEIVCELTREPDNIKVGIVDYVYTSCTW